MKPSFIRLFLYCLLGTFIAGYALAQDSTPTDLTIVPHGGFYRGGTTEFSLLIGPFVKSLNGLSLTIDGGYEIYAVDPTGNSVMLSLPVVVSNQLGMIFTAGDLVQDAPPNFGTAYLIGGNPVYSVGVGFPTPVSGPGELLRFKVKVLLPDRATPSWRNGDGAGNDGFRITPSSSDHWSETPYLLDNYGPQITAQDNSGRNLSITATPVVAQVRMYGDIDGDGHFDLKDVTLLLRAALGLVQLDASQQWYGDISPIGPGGEPVSDDRAIGDGMIDLRDVTTALQVVTGLWKDQKLWWPDPLP